MSPRIPRAGATRLATVTALVAAGLAATAAGATGSAGRDDAPRELARAAADDTTQIVMVKAPTVEQRNEVIGLGLDVTEHADKHGIEVVLHDAQDAQTLRDAGFTWRVTVKDLEALTKKNAKVRRLRELHPEIRVRILYQRDYVALLEKYGLEEPEQWKAS